VAVTAPLVLSACGSPTLAGTESTWTYCVDGGVPLTLDVFEPDPVPTHPAPMVIDVHGGGWVLGNADVQPDSLDGQVERTLVGDGWVFASINYRLAPQWKWPAQIEDAMCSVRYVRAHAATLHVDPNRIGAMGASAGGQLVSLLGLAPPAAGFGNTQWADQSSTVNAVVDEYGPSDLTNPTLTKSATADHLALFVFGAPIGTDAPVLVSASPVTYVHAGAPPFLIIQGEEDTVVPPDQSTEFAARLKAAGDDVRLVLVAHADHGLVPSGGSPSPTVTQLSDDTERFFTAHLGPPG
jgi:acetyl esterase/lipase